MSKVALIPPIASIEHHCSGRLIQMALAHLVDKVPAYRQVYQRLSGHSYIVLDNGAWETNASYTITSLCKLAETIGAREIVLPDVLQDTQATIAASKKAIDTIRFNRDFQFNYAFVLHGLNLEGYLTCLQWALEQVEITTIMLPKLAEDKVPGGRAGMLTWLKSIYPQEYRALCMKRVHMLGIWHNPLEVYNCNLEHPGVIDSVDSALPFHMAYNARAFDKVFGLKNGTEKTKRPEGYFDYIETQEDTSLAGYNVRLLDYITRG